MNTHYTKAIHQLRCQAHAIMSALPELEENGKVNTGAELISKTDKIFAKYGLGD